MHTGMQLGRRKGASCLQPQLTPSKRQCAVACYDKGQGVLGSGCLGEGHILLQLQYSVPCRSRPGSSSQGCQQLLRRADRHHIWFCGTRQHALY